MDENEHIVDQHSDDDQTDVLPLCNFTPNCAFFVQGGMRDDIYDRMFAPLNDEIQSAIEFLPSNILAGDDRMHSRVRGRVKIWNQRTTEFAKLSKVDSEEALNFAFEEQDGMIYIIIDLDTTEEERATANTVDYKTYKNESIANAVNEQTR